jgi:flagellar basal body-associated protein FliL
MKSKIKIIVPVVLLLVGGGVYKFVIAKPVAGPPPKIKGMVYVLPKEFLVNLSGGRFAKLGVGLVISEQDTSIAEAAANKEAVAPPDGFGPLPQEAAVRDIVTDTLTDRADKDIIDRAGRERLKERILKAITTKTDVKAEEVLFTDVAVQ